MTAFLYYQDKIKEIPLIAYLFYFGPVELSQLVRRKDTQGLLRKGNSPVNCLMQSNGQELCCCPGRWFAIEEDEYPLSNWGSQKHRNFTVLFS